MRHLRRTFSPREFRLIAYAALAVCTLIVFTGAAVRLTGSGLGCPDWPRCTGTKFTPELKTHTLIEYGNRMMTSVVLIPCLLAVWGAWRRRPFRRDLLITALLLPAGVLGQIVLGGLTVLYGLAPGWVIGHFLVSMGLLVVSLTLVWKATYEPGTRPPGDRLLAWPVRALAVLGALTLVLGTIATAAGPHAGGEGTGDEVVRLDWRGAKTLEWAIHQHGAIATLLGLGAVGVWFLARARGADEQLRNALTAVCVLMACQGFVGATQYALELPAEIVWFHVVLAALTWLSLLWATAAAGRFSDTPMSEPVPVSRDVHTAPR